MLRYIAWLCVRDDSLIGAQICFVTGPRIELAIELIKRMKVLFNEKLGLVFTPRRQLSNISGLKYRILHRSFLYYLYIPYFREIVKDVFSF